MSEKLVLNARIVKQLLNGKPTNTYLETMPHQDRQDFQIPVEPEIASQPLYDEKNHWREFLCVQKLDPAAILPKQEPNSVGWDLFAFEETVIPPNKLATMVKTKVKISVPHGSYGRIASKYNLSTNHNIEVGAGVIDPGYQGEILVVLRNLSAYSYTVKPREPIAQLILERASFVDIREIKSQNQAEVVNDNKERAKCLCVEKMHPEAFLPVRAYESVGWDLFAFENTTIAPSCATTNVKTMLKISMPYGTYGRIASKSGMSVKHNVEVAAGVIHPSNKKEIIVTLRNFSDVPLYITAGEKIAQLILERVAFVDVKEVKNIEDLFGSSKRGAGGFGSSGRR